MAKILSIPIGGQDIRCWGSEPARSCSSKALYSALNPATMGPHWPWKHLWKLDLPSKFLFFTWRAILNKLSTADCLQKLNQEISPICSLCHQEEESVNHLFVHCPITKAIWNLLPRSITKPTEFKGFNDWFWSKVS